MVPEVGGATLKERMFQTLGSIFLISIRADIEAAIPVLATPGEVELMLLVLRVTANSLSTDANGLFDDDRGPYFNATRALAAGI